MNFDARISQARTMRADGMLMREIAEHFGVSRPTVHRWTTPGGLERAREISQAWKDRNREANRARDMAYYASPKWRGQCKNCGMLRGIGAVKRSRDGYCQVCVDTIYRARRSIVEGMWADGWTCQEVFADVLGGRKGDIGPYRAAGYDLPHRRTPEQVERIRSGSMRGRGLAA